MEKKAEVKALLEKEMATIKVGGKQPSAKITKAEIMVAMEKRNQAAKSEKKKEEEKPIEENLNRIVIEGESAHGIDEALSILRWAAFDIDNLLCRYCLHLFTFYVLCQIIFLYFYSVKDSEVDRHPEKRMKAAYASFEEKMMPIIKEQNPTLRLSQLKQILKKEWMKSPENPLNQKLFNNWY